MFSWFKRRKAAPAGDEAWVKKLVWLPVGHPDNRFSEEVLDCREVALKIFSATSIPDVAQSFGALRDSDGRELIGKLPDSAVSFPCDLGYVAEGQKREGPLFRARRMEEKWDFFFYDSRVYIRRSWTGRLIYVAEGNFDGASITISRIHCEPDNVFTDAGYAVTSVNFLITSHLLGKMIPFPIPPGFPRTGAKVIAVTGFNQYGRGAQFASFRRVGTAPKGDGEYRREDEDARS